jgi:hypothetical protein
MTTTDQEPEHGDPEDAEVIRLLSEAVRRDRGYASFGQWPMDKGLAEYHGARVLLETLAEKSGQTVRSLTSNGQNDPPDCTAVMDDGSMIAVEITELVDQEMIAAHARRLRAERDGSPPGLDAAAPYAYARWTCEAVVSAIRKLLVRKDIAPEKRNGGPYSQYVILITTDEPAITLSVLQEVSQSEFQVEHIDRAFVLMSYEPVAGSSFPEGRPLVPLTLRRQ